VRLDAEHLQKQLFKAEVSAPVDGAEVVAVMEVAVIEELLSRPGKARQVVPADQARKRLAPRRSSFSKKVRSIRGS